ncbi:(2Fe-2S)-binding protein [Clostridium botulinum]|nr:(2Fe-2S)-binding protein [Clostridium botulinum]NFR15611.1 (2Fe-2S)-binding protein [Clostridium botulinum]NFR43214.1 (2Fe-2S)-binding protein [Clostridium botulinum]NFS50255.1 (2Fe-2S)-binding protein [Clostridium botulinum]
MSNNITFKLNGNEVVYDGSATDRLLDVLRDYYHLKGVKCGCKEGECGACSILMDGELINSCMVAMGRCEGSEIVTIEGFRETEHFKVIDKAYADVSAVQCGYCIPGMVLATEAILSKTPNPTLEQIREGISGNLCRCTGYNAIVKAIKISAEEGKGLW